MFPKKENVINIPGIKTRMESKVVSNVFGDNKNCKYAIVSRLTPSEQMLGGVMLNIWTTNVGGNPPAAH